MKIVFDLDYTLLDTVKFKEALVAATGADVAKYEIAYADAVERGGGRFDPDILFDSLVENGALAAAESEAARERFGAVVRKTEDYLYPEAKEMLEALRKFDVAVDLLTFGNKKWQEEKVKHSGLAELFGAVHCTEQDKKEVITNLGKDQDKVIVVNDNGKEMEEMMEAAPEYRYVLKKGPKPVSSELRLPTAESINDLVGILETETGFEIRKEMQEAREAREAQQEARRSEPPEGRHPGMMR